MRTSFKVFVAFAILVVKGLGDDFLFIYVFCSHKNLNFSFLRQAYNLPSFFIYHTHADFDMIPAVRRVNVIHEPCKWPSSLLVSRSSVVRASDRCTEGHRFNSCRGLRFFLCSVLVTC